MSMVERVAEALHKEDCRAHDARPGPFSSLNEGRKDLFRDQARAAINAMSSPTMAMVDNALDDEDGCLTPNGRVEPRIVWARMIEAAGK